MFFFSQGELSLSVIMWPDGAQPAAAAASACSSTGCRRGNTAGHAKRTFTSILAIGENNRAISVIDEVLDVANKGRVHEFSVVIFDYGIKMKLVKEILVDDVRGITTSYPSFACIGHCFRTKANVTDVTNAVMVLLRSVQVHQRNLRLEKSIASGNLEIILFSE